jgi:transcriptional regulator with XRE-family HTH domain
MTITKYKICLSLNIKRLRKDRCISQEKLADQAGIDRTLISKIEGTLGNPTLGVMVKVATALEVGVCDLLCPVTEQYRSK